MKDNFYNKSFFILVYSGLLNKMTMFSKYVINAYGNSEIYNIRNTALKKMRTLLSNSIIIAHKSSHVVVDWNTVLFRSGFFNLSCAFVPLFFHRVYRYIANSKIKMVMSDMKNDILNGGLALWGAVLIAAVFTNICVSLLCGREITIFGYMMRFGFICLGLIGIFYKGRWKDAIEASYIARECRKIGGR